MKGNSRMFSGTQGIWTYNVPMSVYNLYEKIMSNNGTPPKNYKGGRNYENEPGPGEAKLPNGVYKEYDVKPKLKGQGRGQERLVIESNGDAYYTDSHYKSFKKLDLDKKD